MKLTQMQMEVITAGVAIVTSAIVCLWYFFGIDLLEYVAGALCVGGCWTAGLVFILTLMSANKRCEDE